MCCLAEQKLHTNNCTAQLFLTILLCAVQVGLGFGHICTGMVCTVCILDLFYDVLSALCGSTWWF